MLFDLRSYIFAAETDIATVVWNDQTGDAFTNAVGKTDNAQLFDKFISTVGVFKLDRKSVV